MTPEAGVPGGDAGSCVEAAVPQPGAPQAPAAGGHRGAALGRHCTPGLGWHLAAGLAGLRQPIVVVLLAIAFFTAISGKPLDGALLLAVAASLAWDAGRRGHEGARPGRAPGPAEQPPPAEQSPRDGQPPRAAQRGAAGQMARERDHHPAGPGGRRALAVAALLGGGALYAGVVGSFSRYSWPATAGIAGLGAVVVMTGWHGPVLRRPARDRLPASGAALWAGLLVLGGLWELVALLRQPSLTATSYAHPTISALTDPVLASAGGRSLVLAAWLAIGGYLVRR